MYVIEVELTFDIIGDLGKNLGDIKVKIKINMIIIIVNILHAKILTKY